MNENVIIGISVLLAYLIGSIPTAIWLGKSKYGIDVREHGSGNAGATNTFRVLGKKAGITVMVIDILKAFLATSIPLIYKFFDLILTDERIMLFQLICGILAVLGHIFPVYENFKGGKGVASLLGMVLAINLPVAAMCLGVFLVVFSISKYVSLGSIIAAMAYPLLWLLPRFQQYTELMVPFGTCFFILVVVTHKKNIKRLIRGEENKSRLFTVRKGNS